MNRKLKPMALPTEIGVSGQTLLLAGIGGAGMRGLAALLQAKGCRIIGTDSNLKPLLTSKEMQAYELAEENEAARNVKEASLVIYSDALPDSHEVLLAAKDAGIPAINLFTAVGMISAGLKTVAVAGTHGKSSTTAMLAHILITAGLDPSVLVGAQVPGWTPSNARTGQGPVFITEADEYRDHFLQLRPAAAIITSIDWDHPDYFPSLARVGESFQKFVSLLPPDGVLVTTEDVRREWHKIIDWPKRTIVAGQDMPEMKLALPGQHMQQNAWLAAAMAETLGIAGAQAVKALETFPGLKRRFELLGAIGRMRVYSDYGHHPAEIAATLKAAGQFLKGQRVLALLEPHTEDRFVNYFDEYAAALRLAAGAAIYPIYRARQAAPAVRNSTELAAAMRAVGGISYDIRDAAELEKELKNFSQQYDAVIAFTAGELDGALRKIVQGNG